MKEGKIKFLGLSDVSSVILRRAYFIFPISAVQIEHSPISRKSGSQEIDILATCKELGGAVVAYPPLGRGYLAGQPKTIDDLIQTTSMHGSSLPARQFSSQYYLRIETREIREA